MPGTSLFLTVAISTVTTAFKTLLFSNTEIGGVGKVILFGIGLVQPGGELTEVIGVAWPGLLL